MLSSVLLLLRPRRVVCEARVSQTACTLGLRAWPRVSLPLGRLKPLSDPVSTVEVLQGEHNTYVHRLIPLTKCHVEHEADDNREYPDTTSRSCNSGYLALAVTHSRCFERMPSAFIFSFSILFAPPISYLDMIPNPIRVAYVDMSIPLSSHTSLMLLCRIIKINVISSCIWIQGMAASLR